MGAPAHPEAMAPSRPGTTRTAPPQRPPKFPMKGRYRNYVLFDATGLIYLLVPFVILRAVWALGSGEAAWMGLRMQMQHPAYIVFHLVSLVAVVFVAVRFFSLFPKAQPPRIGPAKPPPQPLILAGLYGAWIAVTALMFLILTGGLF